MPRAQNSQTRVAGAGGASPGPYAQIGPRPYLWR